jgi:hypothetical protein
MSTFDFVMGIYILMWYFFIYKIIWDESRIFIRFFNEKGPLYFIIYFFLVFSYIYKLQENV